MKKLILTSLVVVGLFTACSDKKEEVKQEATKTQATHETKMQEHKEAMKTQTKEVAAKVETKKEEIKTEVKKAVEKVETKVVQHKEEMKTEAKEVMAKVQTKANTAKEELSGKKLFATCAGCHGLNGEKKALGQSAVIQGWDVAKLEKALHGYKDGSYGGAMKGVMKGQAARLDDAKITAIAKYISSL